MNVYAHYVIDTWIEHTVKPRCRGRVALFRYADDGIVCCQYAGDADRIRKALGQRLAKYGLALNEEKTRMVTFSRRAQRRGEKQGAYNFLGFTFYLGRTSRGTVIPKVKTEGKRFRSKLKRVGAWARQVRKRLPLKQIWTRFRAKLRGHIEYYAVSFNSKAVHLSGNSDSLSPSQSPQPAEIVYLGAIQPLPASTTAAAGADSSCAVLIPYRCVNDIVLSLLPELGTMGSNGGEVRVTGLSTQSLTYVLLLCIQ